MNAIPILFLSLVAVANSAVPPSDNSAGDSCEEAGPEVYCHTIALMRNCNAEAFCEEYLRKSVCERGPEVYCKTEETIQSCDKVAYCMTWPDDSVTAIEVHRTKTTTTEGSLIWGGLGFSSGGMGGILNN